MKLYILSIFTVLFTSNIKADWQEIAKAGNGHTFYVDKDDIQELNEHIYFWELIDYSEPDIYGDKSAKIFIQGDCIRFRFKWLNFSYHKNQMANDIAKIETPSGKMALWQYPISNSTASEVLKYACNSIGLTL